MSQVNTAVLTALLQALLQPQAAAPATPAPATPKTDVIRPDVQIDMDTGEVRTRDYTNSAGETRTVKVHRIGICKADDPSCKWTNGDITEGPFKIDFWSQGSQYVTKKEFATRAEALSAMNTIERNGAKLSSLVLRNEAF